MSRFRFQFKLGSLLSLAVAICVVIAFWTHASFWTLSVMVVGCCGFLLFNFPRYRKHPALVGAVVGIVTVSIVLLVFALTVVVEAPVYQGQLYHEDGPEAFFMIWLILWGIGSAATSLFGMLAGVLIDLFMSGVASFEAKENEV